MRKAILLIITVIQISVLLGCSDEKSKHALGGKFDEIKYREDIMHNVVATYYSQIKNMEIESPIRKEDLKGTPSWNANYSAKPILAPSAAVLSAQQELNRIVSDPANWLLYGINMQQISGIPNKTKPWIYLVEYRTIVHGEKGRIVIPVLMNGQAIQGRNSKL